MKKTITFITALTLCLAMLLSVSAETAVVTAEDILGDWKVQEAPTGGVTFAEDNKMIVSDAGISMTYTWVLEDGCLYLGATGCVVDGDQLTLSISMPEIGLEQVIVYDRLSGETDLLAGSWTATDESGITREMTFNEDGTCRSVVTMSGVTYQDMTVRWLVVDGILCTSTEIVFAGDTLTLAFEGSELNLYR